jgi:protoheme IX farnesyltransferase
MGLIYSLTALAGSGWFVLAAHRLHREGMQGELKKPMNLFHLSNLYLTALFVAVAVDTLLHISI